MRAIHRLQCIVAVFGANTGVGAVAVVVVARVDTEKRGERAGTDVGPRVKHSHRRDRIGVVIGVKDCGNLGEDVSVDESQVERRLEASQTGLGINRSNLTSLAVTRAGAS